MAVPGGTVGTARSSGDGPRSTGGRLRPGRGDRVPGEGSVEGSRPVRRGQNLRREGDPCVRAPPAAVRLSGGSGRGRRGGEEGGGTRPPPRYHRVPHRPAGRSPVP